MQTRRSDAKFSPVHLHFDDFNVRKVRPTTSYNPRSFRKLRWLILIDVRIWLLESFVPFKRVLRPFLRASSEFRAQCGADLPICRIDRAEASGIH